MRKTSYYSLVAAIVATFGLGATNANAYCVYNHAKDVLAVYGEKCPGCFMADIKVGANECCPGDKKGCQGLTWISWIPKAQEWPFSNVISNCGVKPDWEDLIPVPVQPFLKRYKSLMYYCPQRVPAHGWMGVNGDKADHCYVKDQNGRLLYDGPAKQNCGVKDD